MPLSLHAALSLSGMPIVVPVRREQRKVLNHCGGQLVAAKGWPSPDQRRKLITNQIWDVMGGSACQTECRCKFRPMGMSSNDCR